MIRNKTDANTEHCGTPLRTSSQLYNILGMCGIPVSEEYRGIKSYGIIDDITKYRGMAVSRYL